MPSTFSSFLKSSVQNRRASSVSTDSSRSASLTTKSANTASSSVSSSTAANDLSSDKTIIAQSSSTQVDDSQATDKGRSSSSNTAANSTTTTSNKFKHRLPGISTYKAEGVDPTDPTRSSSVPSIDITSPSSDQPRNLWTPGEETTEFSFTPVTSSSPTTKSPDEDKQSKRQDSPARQSVVSTSSDEDHLYSLSGRRSPVRKMPRSTSSHSKFKSEPGGGTPSSKKGGKAEVLDRHDVMRRAMAEATSSDAFGGLSSDFQGDGTPLNAKVAPSGSVGSIVDNGSVAEDGEASKSDKIGEGSLTFDHFTPATGEGEIVHADGTTTSSAITAINSQEPRTASTKPRSRPGSVHSDAGGITESPTQTIFRGSAPDSANSAVGRSDSFSGQNSGSTHGRYATTGHDMEISNSRQSSLAVPGSAGSIKGSKQMHESASTGNLPSPLQRLRKLSDSGHHGKAKPASGIAGALAASGMAGMGVGHAALLEQTQDRLTPTRGGGGGEKSRSRHSSIGADYIGGYQGGVYRDPKTGKVIEKGPDSNDEEESANRLRFMRDRSATASTHSLASSDISVASGLNAAAHFSTAVAAQSGLNAGFNGPEELKRRTSLKGDAPPLTPGGIGAVGGLSPSGMGERVALGEEEGWPGDMGTQITGFAVASSKRNADFHNLFTSVPEDDYLIEDYGCALVREILIQGRLYVSENHVCFYANIFGWVTNIVLPFSDIVSIEKRMTAYVIPNAIQVATLHSKQTFASFLSRDTTYDLIVNIWKLSHPGVPMGEHAMEAHSDDESMDHDAIRDADHDNDKSHDDSSAQKKKSTKKKLKRKLGIKEHDDHDKDGTSNGAGGEGAAAQNGSKISRSRSPAQGNGSKKGPHRKTNCPCEKEKNHYSTVALDTTYPTVPEKIYNLMFTSGFMKDFWTDNQKLLDLQISDWAPNAQNDNMLSRNLTYIKPLSGGFGPKQTKCHLSEENIHVDFDEYVVALTTTKTPDVPSGGSFSVKTRTCLTWAGGNVTKLYVTCQVDWTGRSMVKGIIDRASIDGQKTYYKDLDVAIRKYIKEHASEFREEGDDENSKSVIEDQAESGIESQESKEKEAGSSNSSSHSDGEAKQGLAQFMDILSNVGGSIFDTLSDVFGMISDMAGGTSPSVLILGFVVFLLVVSNLWALGWSSSRDPYDPHVLRKGGHSSSLRGKTHSTSKFNQETEAAQHVAIAVREVLQDYFHHSGKDVLASGQIPSGKSATPRIVTDDPMQELQSLLSVLDDVEDRVANLRNQLKSVNEAQSFPSGKR